MRLFNVLLPLPGLAAYAVLLADVSPLDPGVASIIGSGVTAGVLAWYVVYDVRVRTPAMLAAFSMEQAAIRKSFTDEQSEIRKTFREEQAGLRESYRTVIEGMRATFSGEQNSQRQVFNSEQSAARGHCEKEAAELRRMLLENITAMRTAVHDVRDVSHEFILKASEAVMGTKEDAK